MKLQLNIPESDLVPGINTLTFHYDEIEPEYRRTSGRIIIRETRRAVLLNRLVFRHAEGGRQDAPDVLIEPLD
jgi:hypothetical protein